MASAEERIRALWSAREDEHLEFVSPDYTFNSSKHTRHALIKVAILILAVTALFVWANRPQTVGSPEVLASGTALISSAAPSPKIVVDVEGRVRRPGLYWLTDSARVADAIKAAGGFLPNYRKGSVNLAARLVDGQLLLIGEVPNGQGAAAAPEADSTSRISLNSSSQAQFESLPGVGPVLAQRILSWRTEHGAFKSLDQLKDVPGIGEKVFANLVSYLTL
ncbi:MAG: ComEA family DNA-binding protein [Actinobacteria bacterium]|nr:ComEA family DNA-binding protein [Actinomycetota bacterium]NBY15979.1 ComEA family DNA-binding protein [Actinomycetota bacterium]